MYKLELWHHFAASHQLRNAYSTECNSSLHGHNWKAKVEIQAEYLADSMIADFKQLKSVIDRLDHTTLLENVDRNKKLYDVLMEMGNKVILLDFELTAENLARYLQEEIKKVLVEKYSDDSKKPSWYEGEEPFKVAVTLWEADNASIKYDEKNG